MESPPARNTDDPPDASSEEVRWFRDATDRIWHAYVVIEHVKYGVALEKVRHNWLCLESEGERRFIVPVPPAWRGWTESDFRTHLWHARPDLRS